MGLLTELLDDDADVVTKNGMDTQDAVLAGNNNHECEIRLLQKGLLWKQGEGK